MIFLDSNVVIDVLSGDPIWAAWSVQQLQQASAVDRAVINLIVIAELGRGFDSLDALMSAIAPLSIEIEPLDNATAFDAGRRFLRYRRDRGPNTPRQVMPDFLIGAHARMLGTPLLTRDPRLYRTYFPDLTLITPETDA